VEIQVPGMIGGTITEGSPYPVTPNVPQDLEQGPTPNMRPYTGAIGNPTVNQDVPSQRNMRMSGEWRW
jgi:hypothetical protein